MPGPELRIVEMVMPSGTWYALHQRGWDDADDESGPFLARAGELYVFGGPGALLAWCAATDDVDHELADSPLWADVSELTAVVADEDRYDLTWPGVPAEGPVPLEAVPDLHRCAALLDDLLVALDLVADSGGEDGDGQAPDPDLHELWHADELLDLLYEPEHLDGALSGHRRGRLADVLRAHAAAVVRLVERRLTLPEPATTGRAPVGPAPAVAEPLDVAVPLENVAGVETVWVGLGANAFYTLREIASGGDAPAYLGSGGRLLGAPELAGLRRWLGTAPARDGSHDLSGVPGWDALVADPAAVDLEVYDDDVFDLAEVRDRIRTDLDVAGADAMNDAWLLLADLADWGGWDDVRDALEADQPVGYVLSAVLPEVVTGDPRGARRLAELDLAAVRVAWDTVLDAVAARVDLVAE